jgi:hypothetical protein
MQPLFTKLWAKLRLRNIFYTCRWSPSSIVIWYKRSRVSESLLGGSVLSPKRRSCRSETVSVTSRVGVLSTWRSLVHKGWCWMLQNKVTWLSTDPDAVYMEESRRMSVLKVSCAIYPWITPIRGCCMPTVRHVSLHNARTYLIHRRVPWTNLSIWLDRTAWNCHLTGCGRQCSVT